MSGTPRLDEPGTPDTDTPRLDEPGTPDTDTPRLDEPGTPDADTPRLDEPGTDTPGSGKTDIPDASGADAQQTPRRAESTRPRRPKGVDAPGMTALVFVFFTWEAASSSVSVWLRIVLALCAVPALVDLVKFGVWRARTRSRD
ncbi:hypothetical protein ACWGN5_22925 [Streptomyces sp. NPDC055815]